MPITDLLNYKSIKFKSQEDFELYLSLNLLDFDYKNIHETLGLSPVWWSRLRSNPQDMKLKVVVKLARALKTTPYALLETYGVGAKGMTAGECLSLQQSHNKSQKQQA